MARTIIEHHNLSLLRSPYTPSSEEVKLIEPDIAALDASSAAVNVEITSNPAHAPSLEHNRGQLIELRRRIDKQALKAPIRRLPTELLELIIRAAVPDDWTTAIETTPRFPLLESCYRLRAIGLAMLDLWCTVVRRCIGHGYDFYEEARRYMDRAEPPPIQLVDLMEAPYRYPDPHFDQWMVVHTARFRSFEWAVDLSSLSPTKVAAPFLESATFYACLPMRARAVTTCGLLTLIEAPCLRKVTLTYLLPSVTDLPWAQLTHLTLRLARMPPNDLAVLRSCTSLFMLDTNISANFGVPASPALVLQDLHSLKVAKHRYLLTTIICAPRLANLCIEWGNNSDSAVCSRPITFISTWLRSSASSSIRTLTLKGRWYDACFEQTRDLFRLVPAVERLILDYYFIASGPDLPYGLRRQEAVALLDDAAILPNLKHLTFVESNYAAFRAPGIEEPLTRFALARWANGGERLVERLCLRSVGCERAGYCRCILGQQWMETLKEEGILVDRSTCIPPSVRRDTQS
ncbi:hypothetical protein K523DRAFT_413828 [Schizophyllum commune Tattone D]|nr:hypothetical protein K523DRAFT_413828 [Schizophyllum commune Tattone D]